MCIRDRDKGAVFHSSKEMEDMYKRFIRHVALRYGVDEAQQWIFENWYDGRSERALESYNYLDTFDRIWEIVKGRLPKAKVGGCGLELGGPLPSFLKEWAAHKPVSYTHLDVYKRQVLFCAALNGYGPIPLRACK